MSEDELDRHKNALAERRLEKPKRMKSRHDRMWGEITAKTYNFDRDSVEVGALSKITREDLLAFFDAHICGPNRRKLSIHVVSEAGETAPSNDETVASASEDVQIENVGSFKAGLPLYPLPRSYLTGVALF